MSAPALAEDEINANANFFEGIRGWVTGRYRYEHVNQAFFDDPGKASTLRIRPGLETGLIHGFKAGVEGDFITELGPDDFNNTVNGKTRYPVVVDVESAEVNQAYLQSHHIPGVVLLGGRYRKNLDNQRFVGSIPWRQNDQTFDGATATVTAIPNFELFYGYAANVNRIFSDKGPDGALNDGNIASNIHLLNAKVKKLPMNLGTATGYVYLMDMQDVQFFSNATYGGFLKGKRQIVDGLTFNYYFEYAYQTDFGDRVDSAGMPVSYGADYFHIIPGLSAGGFTVSLAYEELGSDGGRAAFIVPISTAHAYNGFADLFLITPENGLRDYYVELKYVMKGAPARLSFLDGLLIKAQYHEFDSDFGDIDYGNEFDLYVKQPLTKNVFLDFKYANYEAENFGTDREKIDFGLVFSY